MLVFRLEHQGGIQPTLIIGLHHLARAGDPQFDQQVRVVFVHVAQQRR